MTLIEALEKSNKVRRAVWPPATYFILSADRKFFHVPGTEQNRPSLLLEHVLAKDWEVYGEVA